MKDSIDKNTNPELSIIIPVMNEEAVFKALLTRMRTTIEKIGASYEILFVDDFSTDNTRTLIENETRTDSRVKGLFFSRNFGHQAAVSAGLEHCCGNAVVVMDGDLQDPPELIPEMYGLYKAGNEVVYGIRKKRKEGLIKRLCYFLYYRLLASHNGRYHMPKDAGDFCLLSRKVADHINSFKEHGRYVRGIRAWIGFKQIGIPYERDGRYAGTSKYSAIRLFQLAYDGLFSFTDLPLMLVNIFGFVFSTLAILGVIIYLILRIAGIGYVPGFATTIIFILFIGGIQLLMLGIVGEYIKRIFDEVKSRPIYIVERKMNIHEKR
jgi:polyisoprenyl-phosphate glycosyltransferase